MTLEEFQKNYYLFNPEPYGRIFTLVDFGNVRPWAKDFWPEENKYKICVEIDIQKLALLCNLIKPARKFFYYGHFRLDVGYPIGDQRNAKYRSSIFRIDKASKAGFTVRTKELKMIPNYDEDGNFLGKIAKCNFDVEIAMDAILKIQKYDTIMLFSGDSDFGGLLEYLKSKGKKIIIVSTRDRMSKELEQVKDHFVATETLKNLLRYDNKNNTPPLRAEE